MEGSGKYSFKLFVFALVWLRLVLRWTLDFLFQLLVSTTYEVQQITPGKQICTGPSPRGLVVLTFLTKHLQDFRFYPEWDYVWGLCLTVWSSQKDNTQGGLNFQLVQVVSRTKTAQTVSEIPVALEGKLLKFWGCCGQSSIHMSNVWVIMVGYWGHGTTLSELVPTVKSDTTSHRVHSIEASWLDIFYVISVIYIYIHVICIHTYMCRYTMYSSRKHRKCRKQLIEHFNL